MRKSPLEGRLVALRVVPYFRQPGMNWIKDITTDLHHKWIEPPDRSRTMDVEKTENGWYTQGLEAADKLESLLRYEPRKAIQYYNMVHQRRQRDAEKGDFGSANIIYKFWDKRGLLDQVHALMSTPMQSRTSTYGLTPDELIPEQQEFFQRRRDYSPGHNDAKEPLVANPLPGTRIWRAEDRQKPGEAQDLGRHWSIDPISIDRFTSGGPIWQATLDGKHQIWPKDHPIWQADPSYGGEYEIRLRPNVPVDVEGYWMREGEPRRFWPYPSWPDNLQQTTGLVNAEGWKFYPVGQRLQVGLPDKAKYRTRFDWQTPEDLWTEKNDNDYQNKWRDAPRLEDLDAEKREYYRQLENGNPWSIGKETDVGNN